MKKILSVLLIALFVISVCSCGSSTPEGSGKETAPESGSPNSGGNASEPAAEENYVNDNLNFETGGLVAEDDGCAYFVNMNFQTDGYWRIIRIGDEKDAEPEVIYTGPEDGPSSARIWGLAISKNRVYFFERSDSEETVLKWVAKDGSESGTAKCSVDDNGYVGSGRFFNDGKYLYFLDYDYLDSFDDKFLALDGFLRRFDMDTETEEAVDLSGLFASRDYAPSIIGVHHNKVYYGKGSVNTDEYVKGIYYSDLSRQEEKELCSFDFDSVFTGPGFAGNYMYYITADDYVLMSVDLTTGEKYTVCALHNAFDAVSYAIREDTVYYFDGSGLHSISPEGTDDKLLIEYPGGGMEENFTAAAGGWIYYGDTYNDPVYYRVSADGKIFPADPIWTP